MNATSNDMALFTDKPTPQDSKHIGILDQATSVPSTTKKSPGTVRAHGVMVLKTRNAHNLFKGRPKGKDTYPIMGLIQFSSKMNLIYSAARLDDPYADKLLLLMEEKLDKSKDIIEKNSALLKELLNCDGGINFGAESLSPIEVPLNFKLTYSFLLAQLILKLDSLCIDAITAKHVGLLPDDGWGSLVGQSTKSIRSVFAVVHRYRVSGVTRSDFNSNNKKSKEVEAKFGTLPKEILDASCRAKYAPILISKEV